MDQGTVFTKTAKGITQVNQRSASLSKDLMKVLKLIDGKSNFGQLLEKSELDKMVLEKALNTLVKDGFSRIFETRKEQDVDASAEAGGDDFDFTAPGKLPAATQRVIPGAANDVTELARMHEKREAEKKAMEQAQIAAREKAKQQAEARAKAEAEAKARAEAEARALEQAKKAKEASERAKAELEAKMREELARKQAQAAALAKANAELKAKEEAEARRAAEMRAKAEAEARLLAEARVKAEAEAAALAKVRAQAEAEAQKKIQEAADAAARIRAEAEAAALAKARAEAEAKAAAESRAAQEAVERAKAELEQRLREEAARNKEAAERAAKIEAEARAREAEENRRLAELRAQAEKEAKALAEARAKAEAEARALAEARARADEEAKRTAEEAKNSERELKARLKEEIEARIRGEMEQLLRNEMEEKTRGEMTAQIMEEAKLAARAELEERLREERETLHKAEMEARTLAENAERERADMEARLRAEAEARARSEMEARAKAEAENKRLREAEAKARVQVEAAAIERAAAAKRLEAETRAKIEAEARAKVEGEERDRRERELASKVDAERKAREQAEAKARAEIKARETIAQDTRAQVQAELETDMAKRAEIEGRAQAAAFMTAKAAAEEEEDARMRAEQARRAEEIANVLRTKVTPDADYSDESAPTPGARKRPKKKGNLLKSIVGFLLFGIVVGLVLMHVVPMRGLSAKVEKSLSEWMHDDVSISSAKFWLFPTPHLKIEGIAAGKLLDAKAVSGRVQVDVGTLWSGDKASISSVELGGVTLSNDAVRRILTWGKVEGKAEASPIRSITLVGVRMDIKPEVEPFNANLTFTREGALQQAVLSGGGRWTLVMKPSEGGMDLDFSALAWQLPIGAPIPVSNIKLKGKLAGSEIVVPEFEADAMEGKVNGTLKVSWGNTIRLESELSVAKLQANQLIGSLTKDIAIQGRIDGNFSLASEAPALENLLAAPRSSGKFRVGEGSISNVDLVAVMQSDAAGQRAGVTKFAELTGEYTSAGERTAFRNIALQGGVLRGSGALDIGAGSAVSGRIALEIRSKVAQDRGTFTVSGTVAKPSIRRGG